MKSTWAWTHRLSSNLPWELFFSGSQEGFFSRDKGETFLQARFLLGSLCGHQLSSFGDSEDDRIQEKEQTFYNTRAFDFFFFFSCFFILGRLSPFIENSFYVFHHGNYFIFLTGFVLPEDCVLTLHCQMCLVSFQHASWIGNVAESCIF